MLLSHQECANENSAKQVFSQLVQMCCKHPEKKKKLTTFCTGFSVSILENLGAILKAGPPI